MKTSIIIPNYNGSSLLLKNLPSVLKAAADEVIVVDDGSSDDSQMVLKKFKKINVISHQKNLGFVKAVNNGVSNASGEIIILLNNDVQPQDNFIKPLVSHFNDESVFAVSCNEGQFSWSWAKFEDGLIRHGSGAKMNKTHISFWASGGSAAFSKDKWDQLSGMDDIYKPFYWEDIDISYRAAKRGWQILWEPESRVQHLHESTISRFFKKNYIEYVSQRNHLIFIWKNIMDPFLIGQHQKKIFTSLAKGKLVRPFLYALLKFPEIIAKREIEKKEGLIKDAQIFSKFANF